MSHAAIAAALTLDGISTPERLVAFSMASYANREHRAWPSAAAAAARAGMSRGRFLAARDGLVRAGMLVIEDSRGGRGRSSTVRLAFAETRERLDAQINARLFESALASSRARGAARLLVAVMAALASDDGQLSGFSTEEPAAAAGLSNTSYRRARGALLASRDVRLDTGLGGRGNTNAWTLTLPDGVSPARPSRPVPPASPRPPLANVRSAADGQGRDARDEAQGSEKGAAAETVSASKGAVAETVCPGKGASTRTVLNERAPKRAPKRAPQTPPAQRAHGKRTPEPQNPERPPSPPSARELVRLDAGRRELPDGPGPYGAVARSTSTSTRCAEACGYRPRMTGAIGSGFADYWARQLARAGSRSGLLRSSSWQSTGPGSWLSGRHPKRPFGCGTGSVERSRRALSVWGVSFGSRPSLSEQRSSATADVSPVTRVAVKSIRGRCRDGCGRGAAEGRRGEDHDRGECRCSTCPSHGSGVACRQRSAVRAYPTARARGPPGSRQPR